LSGFDDVSRKCRHFRGAGSTRSGYNVEQLTEPRQPKTSITRRSHIVVPLIIKIEVEAGLGYAALDGSQPYDRGRSVTGMHGCAIEGPGIGRIDAAGSDPNEYLVSAWLWTQHIRDAEVRTVAHKDRGFHSADTYHALLVLMCGSMRSRR
jgi:hypothetical protein